MPRIYNKSAIQVTVKCVYIYSRYGGMLMMTLHSAAKLEDTLIYFVNTLRPRQNGRYFADDIFKCIFLKENVWILIKMSLKFVPKGPIIHIPALV